MHDDAFFILQLGGSRHLNYTLAYLLHLHRRHQYNNWMEQSGWHDGICSQCNGPWPTWLSSPHHGFETCLHSTCTLYLVQNYVHIHRDIIRQENPEDISVLPVRRPQQSTHTHLIYMEAEPLMLPKPYAVRMSTPEQIGLKRTWLNNIDVLTRENLFIIPTYRNCGDEMYFVGLHLWKVSQLLNHKNNNQVPHFWSHLNLVRRRLCKLIHHLLSEKGVLSPM